MMAGMATTVPAFFLPTLILIAVPYVFLMALAFIDYGKAHSKGVRGKSALMWLTPHAGVGFIILFFVGIGVALALSGR